MPGLTPMFVMRSLLQRVEKFTDQREKEMIMLLSYVGENVVNKAREADPFIDHTGNLRSSIGYVILKDGHPVKLFAKRARGDEKGEGVACGKALAKELAGDYGKGIILIVFAGMEYAAAVESRGYDVITGSTETGAHLYSFLKQELKAL